jgi:pimeloyl-ACP methyl ester carboxylesterase
MRRREVAAGCALVALALASCAGPGGLGSSLDEEMTAIPRDLSGYLAQDVVWAECDESWLVEDDFRSDVFASSTVDCATVVVPAIYFVDDRSKDFGLGLMRIRPGDTAELRGSVFINPGGPGGSGIEQLQWSQFPEELVSEFAFIGFDPRGVGVSGFVDGTQIKCDDRDDFLTYFAEFTPANERELDQATAVHDTYYERCAADNPLWWTLSTANVVSDLEILRHTITPGDALNFIGTSYGTTIAGRYVSEFPDTVGKIVLDSPTSVSVDTTESDMEWWRAQEEKLDSYLAAYADFAEVSGEVAWERLLIVRQNVDDGRMSGYVGIQPHPEFPGEMVSPESVLTWGIIELGYLPDDLAEEYFIQALDDAYRDRWMGIFEWLTFDGLGYDPDSLAGPSLDEKDIERNNEFEVRVIVNQMDFTQPFESEEDSRQYSRVWKEAAPQFSQLFLDSTGFEYFGPEKGLSWYSLAVDDPSIPDPPSEPFIPSNPSGAPLLIVGSLYESVTPFSFAEETAKNLASPLITVDSEIHGPLAGYDNSCVNEVLIDYLLDRRPVVSTTCPRSG